LASSGVQIGSKISEATQSYLVSDEFKIFTNGNSAIIDPKSFDDRSLVTVHANSVIIPPNSFAPA
jgi:deoxycytidine triphosphate deaminase